MCTYVQSHKGGAQQGRAERCHHMARYQCDFSHTKGACELFTASSHVSGFLCVQVVMAVAQLYHHVAPSNEIGIIVKPLIRLLKSHRCVV